MAFDPHKKKQAFVYANNEFVCVESCAGYRRTGADPAGVFILLRHDVASDELRDAVIKALSAYRVLEESEITEFFAIPRIEEQHRSWQAKLMQQFGYRTKRELYRGLRHVPVRLEDSTILLRPTRQDRHGGWEGLDHVLSVELAVGAKVIGDHVKIALLECV